MRLGNMEVLGGHEDIWRLTQRLAKRGHLGFLLGTRSSEGSAWARLRLYLLAPLCPRWRGCFWLWSPDCPRAGVGCSSYNEMAELNVRLAPTHPAGSVPLDDKTV